jgi:hypothetical protein
MLQALPNCFRGHYLPVPRKSPGQAKFKVEESIMDEISNIAGENLVKVMFGIFLTLAIRNK